MYIGRSRSRPARIRRSATNPLGNPAHGQDSPPAETWILIGMLPALIKQEDFKRVQVKLALNKKQATRTYARYSYLLRALVSCGACQSACIARTTNGGLRYYICRCQAQPIDSQHDQRCRARCIPAQQLDVLVWERVCQLITLPDYNIEALQRARGGQWLPQQLQSRKEILRKAQVGISQQVGKTDRGSPDGDHPTGRGPTAEVRVGVEKPGAGGSNEGTGGPSLSAGGVVSVGFIDRGFLPSNPRRFGQCNV